MPRASLSCLQEKRSAFSYAWALELGWSVGTVACAMTIKQFCACFALTKHFLIPLHARRCSFLWTDIAKSSLKYRQKTWLSWDHTTGQHQTSRTLAASWSVSFSFHWENYLIALAPIGSHRTLMGKNPRFPAQLLQVGKGRPDGWTHQAPYGASMDYCSPCGSGCIQCMATYGPSFVLLVLILRPALLSGTAYPTLTELREETAAQELSSWSYIWGKYFPEGTHLSGLFCDLVVNLLTECFLGWKISFCWQRNVLQK